MTTHVPPASVGHGTTTGPGSVATPVAPAAPVAPADHARSGWYLIEELATQEELVPHIPAWEDLAMNALMPNPALEPFYHLPALRHFARNRGSVITVLIWHAGRAQGRSLAGLVSCRLHKGPDALLNGPSGSWAHHWTFLGAPLLDRDHAGGALEAFISWFARGHGPRFLFKMMPADGPARAVFDSALGGHATATLSRFERAIYDAHQDAESYMREALSGHRRNRIKRLRRRLEECGTVTEHALSDDDDIDAWLERFKVLEASGWKGRAGTAIASADATGALFDEIASAARREKRLRMWALDLDGKPVSMMMAVEAGDTAFLLKMAYDEDYAWYSPGMLLMPVYMNWGAERPRINRLDSCSGPGQTMMGHFWQERAAFEDVLIDCTGKMPDALQRAAAIERARRSVRARLKRLYRALRPQT